MGQADLPEASHPPFFQNIRLPGDKIKGGDEKRRRNPCLRIEVALSSSPIIIFQKISLISCFFARGDYYMIAVKISLSTCKTGYG
jgi:hypothetical protein